MDKIDWTLSLAGSPCGQVIKGARDAELTNSLDSFAMLADEEGGDFGNYDRVRLLTENPDR